MLKASNFITQTTLCVSIILNLYVNEIFYKEVYRKYYFTTEFNLNSIEML